MDDRLVDALAVLEKRVTFLERTETYDNWVFSTFGAKEPNNHHIVNIIALVVGSVFAGYTATAFPEKFLKLFEFWPVQLAVFFVLSFSTLQSPITRGKIKFTIYDSILMLVLFNLILYILRMIYKKEESNKDSKK